LNERTGHVSGNSEMNKSLFASFSSEKEESCSFLKKRTKDFYVLASRPEIRDLAGQRIMFCAS
jgi:hypothetical protein